mgnify:CR=1 FL=1
MNGWCGYEMRTVGTRENLQKLERIMNNKESIHMDGIHYAESYDIKKMNDQLYIGSFCGECTKSVYFSMVEGEGCFYPGRINGTSLVELSKELDLKIEIYSIEPVERFEEHYFIKDGKCIVKEKKEYEEYSANEKDLTKEQLEEISRMEISDAQYDEYQKIGSFTIGGFDVWNFQYIKYK